MSSLEYNNQELAEKISIITQFQSIVSVKRKSITGVEALSRGVHPLTNEIISPYNMFKKASKNINNLIKLDRLCRESALLNFKKLQSENKDLLLFLNIESSILDTVEKSNYLIKRVLDIGLSPYDIVLEINESRINNIDALISFVKRYRAFGFIIALDDIGAGFSNLDRIPLLGPDIIKIDRFILSKINEDYYKKEVFKSLVALASNTGSLVVAEGIETVEEATIATELGADMMQGFFFSKPVYDFAPENINSKIINFIGEYKSSMDEKNERKKLLIHKLKNISSNILETVKGKITEDAEKALKNTITKEDDIECMYILNPKGIQISDTVFHPEFQRKNKNVLFLPAYKGTDHSIKGYYYDLVNNNNIRFISHKYMSMATGNMCITLSEIFYGSSEERKILCIDFLAEQNK